MEHLNQTFFLWLNAPEHANALVVTLVRISAIVDACFRLIVDGESVLPWRRWGSAQELV